MLIQAQDVHNKVNPQFHEEDPKDFRWGHLTTDETHLSTILQKTLEYATEFLSSINDRPVGVSPVLPHISIGHEGEGGDGEEGTEGALRSHSSTPYAPLSVQGVGAEAALTHFKHVYSTSISGSTGPRYLGFVTGGSTPAAIAGDWLVSTFDQNAANSGDSSANHIEKEVVHWLKELFNLSNAHSGGFVSGATMANFVGLAIARQWVAQKVGVDVAKDGLYSMPKIKVLSGMAHSSTYKALAMLGMGRGSLESVQCLGFREAVDVEKLRGKLQECKEKGEVCIVVGNAGTVNSGDFDDLVGISKLKKEFEFWLHVDAAFGGFATCSPKFSKLVDGLDNADSITVDAHKWLNVPYDSAMQFTRHRQLQVEVFQNQGAYLGAVSMTNPDFVHLTPENSRRFRALPAWFSLMAYGKEGYKNLVEQSCKMAFQLGEILTKSPHFTVLTPPILNIVTFTIGRGDRDAAEVFRFLNLLNQKGDTFMTATRVGPHAAIRAAFSNWRTMDKDVELVWHSLVETYVKGGFRRKNEEQEDRVVHEKGDEKVTQEMKLKERSEEEMGQQEIEKGMRETELQEGKHKS
ncbi:unnamed protein product [Calypogeia fissa]